MFKGVDLTSQDYPSYGVIKFHPIVQDEISAWKRKHAQKGKHKKIDKFGLEFIENALKISRTNVQVVNTPTSLQKTSSFARYDGLLKKVVTGSAPPTENDWLLLFHAEMYECYMVTNDDGVYKVGKMVIGDKSLQIEDLIIDLLIAKKITIEQVKEYNSILLGKREGFDLVKILLHTEVIKLVAVVQ